ncbi:MAG TPA: hypothetical protein DEH78_08090 [Solibacterales bacterium]|nr:hypothetical protein [Bryobacterales bacterium]
MAPPAVSAALAEPGRALDPGVRGEMEKRLGHDFGKVRIHTGAPAERSADEVQAAAYTVGRHIVFGAGRYAPSSREGSRLLAHELVHTVQQGMAAYDGRPLPVGEGSAPEEQTAEAKARQL